MTEKKENTIDERVQDAPQSTGVYIMKDTGGSVLYVGKAKNLRSRVQSYFRKSGDGRFSTTILRKKVRTVEYVCTGNEQEALLLEDKLIKEYRPKYNVDLKDDKRYISVKIHVTEEFPRISIVHQREDDGSMYFGPFARGSHIKKLVRRLQEKYQLRRCSGRACDTSGPCMYAQIDACSAPCSGKISQMEYMARVQKVMAHLRRVERLERAREDAE